MDLQPFSRQRELIELARRLASERFVDAGDRDAAGLENPGQCRRGVIAVPVTGRLRQLPAEAGDQGDR
jgi:hypothetical protein